MSNRSIKSLALCSTALLAVAYAPAALAQEAAAAEEVVVTGSRIITNGFASPTPVTVITMEQMQATGPNSLSDAINQLPSFRNGFTPQTTFVSTSSTSNAGGAFVDLRGLQPKRQLTLLNGERVVSNSASAGSSVDLNTLPQNLVKRVDVTTGGGSAAYGSDALSGVVNLILDTKFVGLKGEVRGGESTYGDNRSLDASIAGGMAFAGGKGHVIASYEYYHTTGIKNYASGGRDWTKGGIVSGFANPNCPQPQTSTACPTRIITGPVITQTSSSGGLITGSSLTGAAAASLVGQTFIGNTGSVTTQPFPFGTLRGTTTAVGGGIDPIHEEDINLIPTNWRQNAYVRAEYEIAPDWTVHADALYGWSASKYLGELGYNAGQASNSTAYPAGLTQGFTIFADNVFLPASVANILKTAPIGANALSLYNPATGLFNGPKVNSIVIGRVNYDWPIQYALSNFSTLRASGGIDGKFNALGTEWTTTAYGTYGRGMHTATTQNDAIAFNLYNAVDAVASPGGAGLPAVGTPMCRSTITNRNDGCVPLNVIGQNVATPAALNYIYGGPTSNAHVSQVLTQTAGDFAIHGEPFSTWAGPVTIGGGAAYRKETVITNADAIANTYNPAIPGTNVYKPGLTAPLTINGFPGATVVGGVTGGAGAPRGVKGGWTQVNNGSGFPGSASVKEVFVETLVPVLKDVFLAKQLDINAAFRYADYQYGGGVKNWKIGAVYKPIDDPRIRSSRSHDVRAGNMNDLFAGSAITLAGATDPFRLGTTGQAEASPGNSLTSGNPNIKPEVGDTFTLGAVYSPSYIPGLTLSVDYYNIVITNEINSLSSQTVLNQCFQGNATLCTLITRNTDPTSFGAGNTVGPVSQVFIPVLNSGWQKTAGLDIEASYNLPLSRIWADRKDSLNFRVVMNYQAKNAVYITGGTSIINSFDTIQGGVIAGSGGNVDWQGNFNVNYRNGPLRVNVQERFINSALIITNVGPDGSPNPYNVFVNPNGTNATNVSGQVPNTVPRYFYTDLAVNYKFGKDERYEAFLTVNNLFDKSPPQIGSIFLPYGVIPTNYSVYDVVGRSFTGGLRFKF